MKDRTKGNIALLLTAIVWGTGFIAQKLGNQVLPPMVFNSFRQLLAAIVLLPLMMVSLKKTHYLDRAHNTQAQLDFKKKKLSKACVFCGFFLMLGTTTQQIGLLTVSAGKSGFISGLYIVFTPLISVFVGRRVNRKTCLCVAVAIVGFAVLSLRGGLGNTSPGDWWTLASAVFFAAQIVSVNEFVDRDNDLIISVLQMAFAGVVGTTIAFIIECPEMSAMMQGLPIIIYAVLFPTATGYTLQIVGQKYTSSTTAALLMSLESVFAAIFGAIFLKEFMSARELLGCAIIFAAVIVEQIDFKKDKLS